MSNAPRPLLGLTFDAAARSHPAAPAFVDHSTAISYEQLHAQAAAATDQLRSTLDPEGAVIALVAADPLTTLAWVFGALRTGAVIATVPPAGPDRAAQLHLLQPDATVECAHDGTSIVRNVERRGARPPAGGLPAGLIVSTAGTTGDPKAIVHSHSTLAHAVRRLQLFRLESMGGAGRVPDGTHELTDDLLAAAVAPALGLRYATTLPLTTMAGLTVAFQALLAGECLVAPATTDAGALLDSVAATGITNISFTPLLAQLVLREQTARPRPDLDHLLFAGIGSGPVPPAVAEDLEVALGCPVAVGYGTTEAGGAITMGAIADDAGVRHHTVGRPLPGVELRVDARTRELAIRCRSNAIGYLGRDHSLTELDQGPRSTGDLAFVRPDGAIELHGRADALILRGGRNIDPVRIEHTLEHHPAVRRAAAFGVSNRAVAGEQDIWTAVELEHAVGEGELRAFCNDALGASLTPRRIISVEALPLTPDGAVRRHEIATTLTPVPERRAP